MSNNCCSFLYVLAVLLQFFVRLDYIRKCFTQKGGIFVLEEYSTNNQLLLSSLNFKYSSTFFLLFQIRKRDKYFSVDISPPWYVVSFHSVVHLVVEVSWLSVLPAYWFHFKWNEFVLLISLICHAPYHNLP